MFSCYSVTCYADCLTFSYISLDLFNVLVVKDQTDYLGRRKKMSAFHTRSRRILDSDLFIHVVAASVVT